MFSKAGYAYETLRRNILHGTYQPGERLRQLARTLVRVAASVAVYAAGTVRDDDLDPVIRERRVDAEPVRVVGVPVLDLAFAIVRRATKRRALDGPLLPLVQKLNAARRENPALQRLETISFLETENEQLFAYVKRTGDSVVVTVVNLDPHHANEGVAIVPAHLVLPPVFRVQDLLSGERHAWRLGPNYVLLEPWVRQAHIFGVEGG